MAEKFVAKAAEMQDGDRRIVFIGDNEIGVFRHGGQYYAYSNFCLHQGGPACEGLTIAKVEERLRPDKTSQGLYFSETQMNFVCPWHGMEYDMKTGECISDRKMKLKKYPIVEKRTGSMSSPKAAAKPVRRPAALEKMKVAATRTVAPKPKTPQTGLSAEAIKLADDIERAFKKSDNAITEEAMQALMGALCRVYSAQVENGAKYTPIAEGQVVSPTGVMVTASGLLRAANLAVFELGMWQSWTGR